MSPSTAAVPPLEGRRVALLRFLGLCVLLACLARADASTVGPVFLPVEQDPEVLESEWWLPGGAQPPVAFVLLQHGFARRCANLRPLMQALAANEMAVVCVNADMARGAPALAADWVERLGRQPPWVDLPDGRPLPDVWIVAGHSAGAAWAVHLAARLQGERRNRLAGLLLLDPVSTGPAFVAALRQAAGAGTNGQVPAVRVLLADPGRCNAMGNARAALEALREALPAGRVTLEHLPGSTHLDAEADASDWLAIRACGQGAPRPEVVEASRQQVLRWAREMAQNTEAHQRPTEATALPR